MTTNPTTTETTACPFCGEPKDPNDTRPCAAGRSEVPPVLRSQPHWLAPMATEDGTHPASVSHGAVVCENRRPSVYR